MQSSTLSIQSKNVGSMRISCTIEEVAFLPGKADARLSVFNVIVCKEVITACAAPARETSTQLRRVTFHWPFISKAYIRSKPVKVLLRDAIDKVG